MKEAYLYKKLPRQSVQCLNCAHYCRIAPKSQDVSKGRRRQGSPETTRLYGRGLCGVRENRNGKLVALNYGKTASIQIDPVEKKPLFHFMPGTQTLSVATAGCNFTCLNCQNYEISQTPKTAKIIPGQELEPKEIVDLGKKYGLPSISYTYVEPTIFSEYAFDTMKLARDAGIKNIWVTNGFLSKEVFDMVSPVMDAANVDIKGFSDEFYKKNCGARLEPVLDTLKRMKQAGVWIEITTLVIPTLSDSPEMLKAIADFIAKELGKNTPWHVTQFCGLISWKLKQIPETTQATLKIAYDIGKSSGLNYVYVGNLPGLPYESTICPACGEMCIEREGYVVSRYDKSGKCPNCATNLNIIE